MIEPPEIGFFRIEFLEEKKLFIELQIMITFNFFFFDFSIFITTEMEGEE